MPLRWEPVFKTDHFFVSPSNEHAFHWIHRWPWPFTHLWIFGPPGSGKTHLATVWSGERNALWIHPDDLGSIHPAECCIMDWCDIDPSTIDPAILYAFLIRVQENQSTCLWTSRQSPFRWDSPLADVTSRIRAMMGVEIQAPDDLLLSKILVKSLRDMGWKIHPRLIRFLVRRMPRSFSTICELTQLVQEHSPDQGLSIQHLKSILRRIEAEEFHLLEQSNHDSI